MTKTIIWIIVALAVGGYFVNTYFEKVAKREVENAESKRIEEMKSAVAAMVSRTAAMDDWERRLSKGENIRSRPIFTVELERVWLQDRPILFTGAIKDIATYDETHYTVLVERSLFRKLSHMFGTELKLLLRATKPRIDSLLEEHPNLSEGFGWQEDVAVIADVNSIQTTYFPGEEGGSEEVKIGEGELIDIIFTGDVQNGLNEEERERREVVRIEEDQQRLEEERAEAAAEAEKRSLEEEEHKRQGAVQLEALLRAEQQEERRHAEQLRLQEERWQRLAEQERLKRERELPR